MVSILTRLGTAEVLVTAQLVCTSWRKICKDPHIWRCIDMLSNKDSVYTQNDLAHLTRIAVDRSCGQLIDIGLEGFGDDKFLEYITDRSPQLTRLRLADCSDISTYGLIATVSKLPLLTEIDLTLGLFSKKAIDLIGRCCPLLKSFKFNTRARRSFYPSGGDEGALAIAANMPGLQHLMLLGNALSNDGLKAILDGCSRLVSLDLRCCSNVNLDDDLRKRCSEQIKDFRGPSESTLDYPYETKEGGFFLEYQYGMIDIDSPFDDFNLWTSLNLLA